MRNSILFIAFAAMASIGVQEIAATGDQTPQKATSPCLQTATGQKGTGLEQAPIMKTLHGQLESRLQEQDIHVSYDGDNVYITDGGVKYSGNRMDGCFITEVIKHIADNCDGS